MAKMYRVYSIIERPKNDDYWLNIGVAFPHEDGKGFNVMLQALPIHGNGKIVLREHEPKADEVAEAPAADDRKVSSNSRKANTDRNSRSSQRQ